MYQFFLSIIKPYKLYLYGLIICPLLISFYTLITNFALKELINNALDISLKGYWGLLYPVVTFILAETYTVLLTVIIRWCELKSRADINKSILLKSYEIIQKKSYLFFRYQPSGSITSKIQNMLSEFNSIVESVTARLIPSLFSIIVIHIGLFYINWRVATVTLFWTVIYMAILRHITLKAMRYAHAEGSAMHKVVASLADLIANFLSVMAFATKIWEYRKFEKKLEGDFIKRQRLMDGYSLQVSYTKDFTTVFMYGSIFLTTIYMVYKGRINVGEIVVIFNLTEMIMDRMHVLNSSLNSTAKSAGNLKAAYQILEDSNEMIDSPNALSLLDDNNDITFRSVSFSYNPAIADNRAENSDADFNYHDHEDSAIKQNGQILKNLNFTIKAGEKIGIVGSSGIGKSTIALLIMRYYDVDKGEILLGDRNIKDIKLETLRKRVSIMHQELTLFNRTIRENILYGADNISNEYFNEITSLTGIDQFAKTLPQGYETRLGDKVTGISGGQKQRIGLARMLLNNSPIMILDEATASLDAVSEKSIQRIFSDYSKISYNTLILIAHRLTTIKNMDRIFMLDDKGGLIDGSHDYLINNYQPYKNLWQEWEN